MDMDKDYYKIMGVSQDASEQDIKTAYRRLARKYHPDISKEPQAEERFKEMGEAYEVLKDPAKRAEYDQFLQYKSFNQKSSHAHNHSASGHHHENVQFNDDFFESLFGHSRYQQQPMSGQNIKGKISITLEEAFKGATKTIQLAIEEANEIKQQALNVKIPAGIKSGQQIRLAGQGGPGINGGPKGDIYLTVEVLKHPLFDLLENDLYLTLPITPWEAALGSTIVVPTMTGKIDLKIPPGSQAGQKLRIKNKGLPGSNPGDQYVLLKIITPPASTESAKELYQKMAEVMPFNPREKMGI